MMIDRFFAIDTPFWQFLLNAFVFSSLCLFPLVVVYVGLTPGFGPMLMGGGLALRLFLRQVVTDGLLVVFIVNYLGFLVYAILAAPHGRKERQVLLLAIDPPIRAFSFILLTGLIYFKSADWFGSFNGDHWLALRVVGPTLARSALFANLDGVYLYAILCGALPVYVTAIDRLLPRNPAANRPRAAKLSHPPSPRFAAIVLAVALSAVSALLVTAIATAIVYIQPS